MNKKISTVFTLLLLCLMIFFACKQSEGTGVVPSYKGQATTTGNNPNVPHGST